MPFLSSSFSPLFRKKTPIRLLITIIDPYLFKKRNKTKNKRGQIERNIRFLSANETAKEINYDWIDRSEVTYYLNFFFRWKSWPILPQLKRKIVSNGFTQKIHWSQLQKYVIKFISPMFRLTRFRIKLAQTWLRKSMAWGFLSDPYFYIGN